MTLKKISKKVSDLNALKVPAAPEQNLAAQMAEMKQKNRTDCAEAIQIACEKFNCFVTSEMVISERGATSRIIVLNKE